MNHDELPGLEEYLGTSSVHHNDPNEAVLHLLDYLQEFQRLINDGAFTENDLEFVEYLDRYCDTDSPTGGEHSITLNDIQYLFEPKQEDFQSLSPRSYHGPVFDALRSDVQFYIIYIQLRLFLKAGHDFRSLKSKVQEHMNKYEDRSPFQLIRSEIYQRGYSQHHFREATSSAHNAVEASDENTRYLLAFVDSATRFAHGSPRSKLDIDGLPSDRSELLDLADAYSRRAKSHTPGTASVYASRSNVLELKNKFDDAEQELNQALRIAFQEDGEDPNPIQIQLESLRRNRENADRAEKALSDVRDEIENLRNESENIEQKLRGDMEGYRNQMLQFIAFFTGILAVIIISIQVTLELQSVQDAMQVIIVLTGSIIFSFSTLSMTVFSDQSKNKIISNSSKGLILGVFLILFGYFGQQIM